MDERAFWAIIERAKEGSGGNLQRQMELVKEQVRMLPPEDIARFERIYRAFHGRSNSTRLRKAMTALMERSRHPLFDPASDDDFSTFRAWLVGCGEEIFCEVTRHPERVSEFVDIKSDWWQLDGLNYIATHVYIEKTDTILWDVLKEGAPILRDTYPLVGYEWLEPGADQEQTQE